MDGYSADTYGERIARVYDARYPLPDEGALDLLALLAEGGPALELGIGTGRVALPLAARGVEVRGVDASPAMVDRLRAKPGGGAIPVHLGDMTRPPPVPGGYTLVYVVFNTFFALLTQDDQVDCVAAVASVLAPGGRFLVDAFVPDPSRFDRRQRISVVEVGLDRVELDAAVYDPASQRVDVQHVVLGAREDGAERALLLPVSLRFAWPAELDLMARLAGLELEGRWGGWRGEPYTGEGRHVSVWRRSDGA